MPHLFARYSITPCPKPRMTRADKWKRRPEVLRYRAFADEARLKIKAIPERHHVVFVLAMPASWSAKRRRETNLREHKQKPDIDNLAKALYDALLPGGDQHLCDVRLSKAWGIRGEIWVAPLEDWR